MKSFVPYLTFDGNAEAAFQFYKHVFGGEFTYFSRFKEMPGGGDLPEAQQEKVMHVTLEVTKGLTLMASDNYETEGAPVKKGNAMAISIDCESKEEIERLFRELSKKGKIDMKLEKTFWNAYFASFEDQYGVCWMLNYDLK